MTPDEWTPCSVGTVGVIAYGLTVNQDRRASARRSPYLTVANLQDGKFDLREVKEIGVVDGDVARFGLEHGDVLLVEGNANSARLGNAALWANQLPSALHQNHLIRIRPHQDLVVPEWLVRALNSDLTRGQIIASAKTSSGLHTINSTVVREIRLLLPPLPEQRKIAAILSSVDDAIESTQAVIEQLGVVKKAMMAELLTRGLPGRHTRFKMTEIGEVPEEWEVVPAGCIFADGPSNGRSPSSRATPPGIPTFSIGAVRDGRVNIHANVKYAEGDPSQLQQVLVHRGDMLIVRGNGNPDLVGRCGVVGEDPPAGCIYPDILMRVRPTEAVAPAFLAALWNSEVVHAQVLDKAKTTNGTYKINGQDVRAILLPVPARDEQESIASLATCLNQRTASEAAYLESCVRVKSALMSVLLTGEVRVKSDEAA